MLPRTKRMTEWLNSMLGAIVLCVCRRVRLTGHTGARADKITIAGNLNSALRPYRKLINRATCHLQIWAHTQNRPANMKRIPLELSSRVLLQTMTMTMVCVCVHNVQTLQLQSSTVAPCTVSHNALSCSLRQLLLTLSTVSLLFQSLEQSMCVCICQCQRSTLVANNGSLSTFFSMDRNMNCHKTHTVKQWSAMTEQVSIHSRGNFNQIHDCCGDNDSVWCVWSTTSPKKDWLAIQWSESSFSEYWLTQWPPSNWRTECVAECKYMKKERKKERRRRHVNSAAIICQMIAVMCHLLHCSQQRRRMKK